MTATKFRPNQKVRTGWILVNFLITTIVWLLESSIFEITTFFFSSVSNVLKEGRSAVTHVFLFNHVMTPPFYPLFFSTFYFCHLIYHVHFHIDALHVLSFTYEIFFSFEKYMLRCNCFWNRKCNRLAVRVSWSYGSWLFWKSELRQLTTLKARINFLMSSTKNWQMKQVVSIFLTYEQKFDELQSDSADFVTTARGKAIAPTSGATKELRTSSTEKSEARRVTVSINTHDVPEWPAHTESVDGATKDGNTCSKGFQDRSLNGKCMLVDSATCCACNQGMENWYAKCRRNQ